MTAAIRLYRGADIRIAVAGGQQDLFYSLAKLFRGPLLSAGQLAYRAIHIGLMPQHGSPVVEQVEVVMLVALAPAGRG